MQCNMPKAAFSITNYYFDKVNINLENKPSTNELGLTFDVKGIFKSAESDYQLTFIVKVTNNELSLPLVEVQCRGVFHIVDIHDINEIPEFFYNNSIAILFPYVRGYVSMVTTQANIPGIILPTLNLTSLGAELKRNTDSE